MARNACIDHVRASIQCNNRILFLLRRDLDLAVRRIVRNGFRRSMVPILNPAGTRGILWILQRCPQSGRRLDEY